MQAQIQIARNRGENLIGRQLSENEFERVLSYATMKAESQGHDRSYVPLLIPDVICEMDFESETMIAFQAKEDVQWQRLTGTSSTDLELLWQKAPEMMRLANDAGLLLCKASTML